MAEIKVNIKGDDSDLKNKFKESSEDARIFKENVGKSLDGIKEASKDIISESGLGGIAKMLGAAGLTGAVVEFSKSLVSGFKDAVSAALDFQGQVGKLRSALGVAFAGQAEAWAEKIQSISGVMGSFEENMKVFRELTRTMVPQQAFMSLVDIQNAAKMLGVSVDELGEKFVEMRAEGEVPPRMFREMPALAVRVRQMLPAGAEMPGAPSEESLAERVKAAGGADWLFRTVLPAIAPGGLQAPGRLGAQQSIRGQFMEMTEEFNKEWRELGQDLLPIVNAALREMQKNMPAINDNMQKLGAELEKDVPKVVGFLQDFFGTGERLKHPTTPIGHFLGDVHAWEANFTKAIIDIFTRPGEILKEGAEQQKAANEQLHRALFPK